MEIQIFGLLLKFSIISGMIDVQIEEAAKLNTQQIKIFLCLGACKNFSLTAEQPQSVVSYHVRMLEKEVGFPLFDRNTHGVEFTPAGAMFYKSMSSLAVRYREALDQARKTAAGIHNKLRICFGTPTSPTMIGQIMDRVCDILPLEKIELKKQLHEDVLQPVLSGTTDILFTYPPFFRKNLGLQKANFCMTWLSCMMCPQHPLSNRSELSFSDLRGQALIIVDSKNAHIEHKEIYRSIRRDRGDGPRLESRPKTFEQAQGFAITGRGIMLVRTMDRKYHSNIDGLVSIPLTDARPIPLIAVWRGGDFCALGRKLISKLPLS